MVYFEMKTILDDAIPSELALSLFGNFISKLREITQWHKNVEC